MSKRHQASRRRTYGRRQHEVRERHDREWKADDLERDVVEEAFAPAVGSALELRSQRHGTAWVGLE